MDADLALDRRRPGHAARRGEPIFFKSLYAYLIAPFWWIHSTETAYAAIKYVNAVVMTLAAVPTYLLARMLRLQARRGDRRGCSRSSSRAWRT